MVQARVTGLPIVPGTWWCRPLVRIGSWDRTIVSLRTCMAPSLCPQQSALMMNRAEHRVNEKVSAADGT